MGAEMHDRVLHADWDLAATTAALKAVIERHAPQPACAGVNPEMFGEGRCAFCARRGQPDRVFRDYLNGSAKKVEQHQHGYHDSCSTCYHDGGYPCEEIRLIAVTLGVPVDEVTPDAR